MATPRVALLPILLAASIYLVADSCPAAEPVNPLDPQRAFGYLEKICEIGPRPSGSQGMKQQIAMLRPHFEDLGGEVQEQTFKVRNPRGGARVSMTNLIVRYRPELKRRVLLCAHYDTRPLPDQDPDPRARRNGTFIGASDGASGVAVLMELAHLMPQLKGSIGVDLVMFDGEELVYRPSDPYFHGSKHFAKQYKNRKEDFEYQWGVLLDMVGDKRLRIYYEKNSWALKQTRPLVKKIWETAARLRVSEFVPRTKHTVNDDHLPLNSVGIPTVDIIDFDYPYWHTEKDIPANCSGESLAKVGWVVWEWLREVDAQSDASLQETP